MNPRDVEDYIYDPENGEYQYQLQWNPAIWSGILEYDCDEATIDTYDRLPMSRKFIDDSVGRPRIRYIELPEPPPIRSFDTFGKPTVDDAIHFYERQINLLSCYIDELYDCYERRIRDGYVGALEERIGWAKTELIKTAGEVEVQRERAEDAERKLEELQNEVLRNMPHDKFIAAFQDRVGDVASDLMAEAIGQKGDIVIDASSIDQEFFQKMHDRMFDLGFQLYDKAILPKHLHF